jgi:ribosome-binding ATPase YchF (GTP1/OBG family)
MAELSKEDRKEFLEALGVDDPNATGLNALVKAAYELLGLRTYFTTGMHELYVCIYACVYCVSKCSCQGCI